VSTDEPDVPETPEEETQAPEDTPASEDASAPEAGRTSETEGEAAASGATASDADASSDAEAPEPEPQPAEAEPAPEPPVAEPEAPLAAAEEPVSEEPVSEEREEAVAEVPAAEPEELPETPRVRPEIPGADLIPDIIPEGDEFLDAEARAAAEAEAEARAEREREEREREEHAQPIADAAIDLAAGARYTATGKRKTAVARVILKPGSGTYAINGKPLDDYFPRETLRRVIRQPLETVGYESRMDVVARMHGGGVAAQAEALRHGISRALIVADPHLRGELKRRGFLTRDPRVKERKKAGLKKARKRPQFSKR
jgi:small subunit ribosomal protein S9